jgi:hypothetical protein
METNWDTEVPDLLFTVLFLGFLDVTFGIILSIGARLINRDILLVTGVPFKLLATPVGGTIRVRATLDLLRDTEALRDLLSFTIDRLCGLADFALWAHLFWDSAVLETVAYVFTAKILPTIIVTLALCWNEGADHPLIFVLGSALGRWGRRRSSSRHA